MGKKILICGATGFIGRNMLEFFSTQKGFEVFGTYFASSPKPLKNVHFIKVDLTKKNAVEKCLRGKHIVIQAAATTSGIKDIVTKPYYHVTDNAVMNSLIFKAAHTLGIKHVIFFSCTVMYQSSIKPLKESDFNPEQEIYPKYFGVGWTKVYLEKMCEFYARLGTTKYTVIRHSNIYGPHDKFDLEKSHVFGATVAKIMNSNNKSITVWGDGREKRDLLYISDLVNFVRLALLKQKDSFLLCNIGYGKAISIRNLVHDIIVQSGKKIRVKYDALKPSIHTEICLDTSKARKLFNWRPCVSLKEGINKTLGWYIETIYSNNMLKIPKKRKEVRL